MEINMLQTYTFLKRYTRFRFCIATRAENRVIQRGDLWRHITWARLEAAGNRMEEVKVFAVRTRKLRLYVPIITANRWPFTALFARSRYALFVFEIAMQLIPTTCSHWPQLARLKRRVFFLTLFLFLFNIIYRGQRGSTNVDRSFFFFSTDYSVVNNLIRLKERFNERDLDETGSTVIHVIALYSNVVIIFSVYFYT